MKQAHYTVWHTQVKEASSNIKGYEADREPKIIKMEQMSQITFTTQDMQDIIKKCQTMFFFQPTPQKGQNHAKLWRTKWHFPMPNDFKKIKFLQFGIKNANLATLASGKFHDHVQSATWLSDLL